MPTTDTALDRRVADIRRFNRFYTRQIGVLREGLVGSPFSLAESRVLYELANEGPTTATGLAGALELDPGYLSRILRGFVRRKLVTRSRADHDGRERRLTLTVAGKRAFAALDRGARKEVSQLLAPLSLAQQERLRVAMQSIEDVLGHDRAVPPVPAIPFILREPRAGDLGWVLYRQALLYAQEYGWDQRFEGLVAGVLADFVRHFDPARERCWIAERDGAIVGSVFLVKKAETVAQLRLLYVESSTRGLGLGRHLVRECIRHARHVGYRTMTLWTNGVLVSARRIYEAEGFALVSEEPHDHFGVSLLGQEWELSL